jgi:hypothetical protein
MTNAKSDEKKLGVTRQYIGEAWAGSFDTTGGELDRLGRQLRDGATPSNGNVFNNIKDKLDKPVYDKLMSLRGRCDNKLAVLPSDIQRLHREDSSYHDMIAAQAAYTKTRDRW